ASDVTKLNASFAFANSSIARAYLVTDTTTVGVPNDSGLSLLKAVDLAQATPGTTITYTLTFTNDSAGNLSNVVIYDSTPAFTTFVSAACPATLPNTLTSCSITSPAASAAGSIKWTFAGTLAPSQSGIVTFKVKIQ